MLGECCGYVKRFYVHILAGASNASGRDLYSNLSPTLQAMYPATYIAPFIYAHREQRWNTAAILYDQPLGQMQIKPDGTFGAELTLGRCLAENPPPGFRTGVDCQVLLKYTSSGSPLQAWISDPNDSISTLHWQRFRACINDYFDQLTQTECSEIVCGKLFWYNGGPDSQAATAPLYVDRFATMIAETNADLGCEFEPVFTQIKANRGVTADTFAAQINASMIAAGYKTTVSNDDLTLMDSIHFDAPSLVKLGERLWAAGQ